jgi:hypothetical protein
MARSLTGTEAQFLACFDATDEQVKHLKVLFGVMKAGKEFEAAAVAAYGEEGAKKLSGGASSRSPIPTENVDKWVETLTVKVEGDQATVSSPDQPKPLSLVRKNGVWLIKPGAMTPPPEQAAASARMMKAVAGVYDKMKARIGQEGVTVESLKAEMDAEMMKAMFGGMPMPRIPTTLPAPPG